MALSLSIPTRIGVNATYHRAAEVQANWASGTLTVNVYSYATKEARDGNFNPIQTLMQTFPLSVPNYPEQNIPEVTNPAVYNEDGTVLIPAEMVSQAYTIPAVAGYTITAADNLTAKAYELLKTTETFKNATDN